MNWDGTGRLRSKDGKGVRNDEGKKEKAEETEAQSSSHTAFSIMPRYAVQKGT